MQTLRLAWMAVGLAVGTAAAPVTHGSELRFIVHHTFAGEALRLNSVRYANSAKEALSITRLSYLLSEFAFERKDGAWVELTNQFAWLDVETARTSAKLIVPAGEYRQVRFDVGLESKMNHADPAQLSAGHPLNPNLNHLHWSWQGGYVFLALEGRWQNRQTLDGFSYHLARDTNRARVQWAAPLHFTNDARLELEFDVAALFDRPRSLSLATVGTSTHSREGDLLAAALVANLPGAFSLRCSDTAITREPEPRGMVTSDLPKAFTPYRFTMSATFPVPELPLDNPLTEERVILGRKLFNEPLLSRDETLSCASCHDSRHAFSDARRFSIGVSNRVGTRQAMPLFNLAWKQSFFWDGRAPSLRVQALLPIQDHAEMDESLSNVVRKLSQTATGYPALFGAAFGTSDISAGRIGLAFEQYLLSLTSFDSKFDRALRGEGSLNDEEQRGLALFMTEYDPRRQVFGADCFHCHGGPLFRSQNFANNGLDASVRQAQGRQFADAGRARVTKDPADLGKFATPSLRNVALTAPYMHDGRFATLEEVVAHYSSGVKRSATLDPNLAKHPDGGLALSPADQRALVAFLKALADEKYKSEGSNDVLHASR